MPTTKKPKKKATPKKTKTPDYDPQIAPFGLRTDGTPKGMGYFGMLKSRKKGDVNKYSTELSFDVDIDGQKLFAPLLVPTLTRFEIESLLRGDEPSEAIYDKAVKHAQERMESGKSPFAVDGNDMVPLPKYESKTSLNPFSGGLRGSAGRALTKGFNSVKDVFTYMNELRGEVGLEALPVPEEEKVSPSANTEVEGQLRKLREGGF